MADRAVDPGTDTCGMCRLSEEVGEEVAETVRLEHPAFGRPVLAERNFAEACGGRGALAARIATTVGDPSAAALPIRLAFARGRGEDYQLHVAHIGRRGDTVTVRRFRPNDPVVSRFRFPRERQPMAALSGGDAA